MEYRLGKIDGGNRLVTAIVHVPHRAVHDDGVAARLDGRPQERHRRPRPHIARGALAQGTGKTAARECHARVARVRPVLTNRQQIRAIAILVQSFDDGRHTAPLRKTA